MSSNFKLSFNKRANILLVAFLFFLAVLLRVLVLSYINIDLITYLFPWYEYIESHGHIQALSDPFSNYTPPYTYLLVLVTYLDFIPEIVGIKLISIVFDFLCAGVMYWIIQFKSPDNKLPWLGVFVVLFAPAVLVDSAYWGQCDIIYTTFLLLFIDQILREKPLGAMISFSIALSFKFQAVFISPFILMLFLKGKIPWKWMLISPAVYFLMVLPAWLMGRPLDDLLFINLNQAGTFSKLSWNAPNLYAFIPNSLYDIGVPVGLLLTVGIALFLAFSVYFSRQKLTQKRLLLAAALVVMAMPYFLPKMHDRYFFPASLFLIALAFYDPEFRLAAVALQATSLLSYLPFLRGGPILDVKLAAIGNTVVLLHLFAVFLYEFYPQRKNNLRKVFSRLH